MAINSRDSHQTSLSLPSVREAIKRGRPLIAVFDRHIETVPFGGYREDPNSIFMTLRLPGA